MFCGQKQIRDIRKDIKSQLARDIILLRDSKEKVVIEKTSADELDKVNKKVLGDPRNNVKLTDRHRDNKPRVNTQIQKVDDVCKFWTTNICKNGENCKYAHPIMCGETLSVGYCGTCGLTVTYTSPHSCKDMGYWMWRMWWNIIV